MQVTRRKQCREHWLIIRFLFSYCGLNGLTTRIHKNRLNEAYAVQIAASALTQVPTRLGAAIKTRIDRQPRGSERTGCLKITSFALKYTGIGRIEARSI